MIGVRTKRTRDVRSQIPKIVGRYLLLSFSVATLLGIYNYTIPLLLYSVVLDRLVVFPFYLSPRFDISRRIVTRPRTRFDTRTQVYRKQRCRSLLDSDRSEPLSSRVCRYSARG
jgi:hypothetical protein